ncbi:MAG: O-antigen ligase family protein [Verrucomicrobiota bacterium]
MHNRRHDRPKKKPIAPYLVIALTALNVVFSSWALGGRAANSPLIIGLLGWLNILPLFIHWNRRDFQGFKRWALLLSPWLLLIALTGFSLLNPLREVADLTDRFPRWAVLDPIPGLPVTYLQSHSWPFVWVFTGSLVAAISLFTVVRSYKLITILLAIIAVNGVALSVIGAWFKLNGSEMILGFIDPVNPKFYASFRYYNHWVGFGILALGAAMTIADNMVQHYNQTGWNVRGRQRWDLVWLVCAALILIALPLCGSRSGMLLSGLFVALASIYLFFAYRNRSSIFAHLPSKLRRTIGLSLVVILGGFTILGTALVWEPASDRFAQTINQIKDGDIDQRFYASPRDCLEMVKARPIWGWGIGSYAYAFENHAGPEYRHPLGMIIKRNEYAHNDWMQFWVELGTFGMILFLAVPIGIIVLTFRQPRAHPETFWLALSCGLFLTLASFDFPFGVPAGVITFFIIASASARLSLGTKSSQADDDELADAYRY